MLTNNGGTAAGGKTQILSQGKRRKAKIFAAVAGVAAFTGSFSRGATFTWNSSGTDFNTAADWTPNTVPGGATADVALFNTVESVNPNLSASASIGELDFSTAATSGYTLSNTNSAVLTLNSTGTGTLSAIYAADTSGTNTISAPLLSGAANTYTQVAGGTLSITGGITATSTGRALTLAGGGIFNISTMAVNINGTGTGTLGGVLGVGTIASSEATLNISSNVTALDLSVGNGTTTLNGGAVYQTAGTLTLTDNTTLTGASAPDKEFSLGGTGSTGTAGYGYYSLSGGSISANSMDVGARATGAVAVMDVSGGTVTDNGGLNMARGNSAASTYGLLNVTGGSMSFGATTTTAVLGMGFQAAGVSVLNVGGGAGTATVSGGSNASSGIEFSTSTGSGTGVVNLLTNGTLTLARIYGASTSATALVNFNGGDLKATATNASSGFLTTNIGAVTVYGNGGTIDNSGTSIAIGNGLLAPTGSGITSIAPSGGAGYIGAPFVNITGGGGTGATAYAVMSGGTVSSIVITNPGTGYTGSPTITLVGGGASTAATIASSTLSTNVTTGGMTFTGSGTTTLTGTSTYAGPTLISGGELLLSSAGVLNGTSGITINGTGASLVPSNATTAETPAITVTKGTLLGGGAVSVGSVTVGAGTGGVVANASSDAILTLNSLKFNGIGTANLNIAGGGTTTTPALSVTNALSTANTGGGEVTLNVTGVSALTAGDTYNLIQYGSLTGGTTDFSLGAVSGYGPRSLTLGLSGGYLTLAVSANPDSPKWTGLDNNNWVVGPTGSNDNWILVNAGTPTNYISGDVVLFDDTGLSAVNPGQVNISAANVTPSSTTFNNDSSLSYTISSTGGFGIAGGGTLAVTGGGTVTLLTSNTYSGATSITSGTLQLGNGTADGSISSTASITDNGSLIYDRVGTYTDGYAISGTGSVMIEGSGSETFSGSNSYSGGTTLSSGTLALGSTSALGAVTGSLTVSGGKLDLKGFSSQVASLSDGGSSSGTVTDSGAAATLTVSGTTSTTFSGTLGGSLSLAKAGTSSLMLPGNESFTGTLTVGAGGTIILSGNNSARPSNAANTTVVNGTLQLQANSANTSGGVSTVLSSEATAAALNLNNGSTVQLRSDGNVTFAGANNLGGVGGATITFDVNQLTSAGSNNTFTFAPSGFNVFRTTINVTGGNGDTLAIGQINDLNSGITHPDVFNPTTGNLSINGITEGTSAGATVVDLSGSSNANTVVGAITNGLGTLAVSELGTGAWTLAGESNTYSGATIISSGTLQLGSGTAGHDGILTATSGITNSANLVYDPAGSATGAYPISGSGNVSMIGSGTITLTGTHSYSGSTTISGGTMVISGTGSTNNTSGITINGPGAKFVYNSTVASTPPITLTQGTLDGTGSVGAVTVGAGTGGIVANGGGGTSPLTLASLTFQGAGIASFSLAGGATTSPGMNIGTLQTPGTANSITVNANFASNVTVGTDYDLLSYSTYASGSYADFVLGTVTGVGVRDMASLVTDPSDGDLALTFSGDSPKWTGLDNSNWIVGSTGPNGNWKLINAGTPTNYISGDAVLFDDTASTGSVNISAANVTPAGTTFNNSSLAYTLAGSFGIAGTGGLSKSGSAGLTINTTNSYTGATTIGGGTVTLNGTLGSGGGTAISNASTFIESSTGVIAGTSSLTTTAGTSTLQGVNSYTGATTINGGTLTLNGTLGSGGGTAISNSSTFTENSTGVIAGNSSLTTTTGGTTTLLGVNTYSGFTSISSGGTLQLGNGTSGNDGVIGSTASVTDNGALVYDRVGTYTDGYATSGTGSVTVEGTGSETFSVGNSYSGGTTLSGGTLTLGSTTALGAATGGLTVSGGTLNLLGFSIQVGSLSDGGSSGGTVTDSGSAATLTVNQTTATTYSGTLTGGLTLVKNGTGTVTLSGSNSYTGGTTIISGILVATNSNAFGTSGTVGQNGNISAGNTRIAGIQLNGGISIPSTISFNTSNDGTGTVPYAIDSTGGNNTINGTITMTSGGGGTVIQSDSGTLTLAGNITIGAGFSSRALVLQGASTGANTVSGVISDLGAGSITSVTKNGTGNWILANTDTFSGATTINAGTLQLGNGTTDGSIAGTSGVTDNGNLVFDLAQASRNPTYLISGTGNVIATGTRTLTFSNTNTYTGTTTVSGGTMDVTGALANSGTIAINTPGTLLVDGANALPVTAAITSSGTTNFTNNSGISTVASIAGTGTLIVGSSATLNITNSLNQGPVNSAGTLNVNGGATDTAGTIDGGGFLSVANGSQLTATYVRQNTLSIDGISTVTIAPNGTSTATSVLTNLSNSGTLDLKNNDLIVANDPGVGTLIATAYNGGAWNQPGITSSSALAHTGYNLGYATVGSGAGQLNISIFDGQPVASGNVAVKYTLSGDLNLDGSVDQNDIALLAPHYGTSSGATWYQGDVNHDGSVDQNDIALIAPNYGQSANAPGNALTPTLTPTLTRSLRTALTRSISPNFSSSGLSGGVSPALNHLYTWDAALPDATAGNVIIKVDNITGDSHFGDVILQGNSATLYTLVITSASGSMNSGRYDSLNAQYNGGGGSEAATLQGLAVDNTTNHSGNFSVFSQTANKINEAGLGVTLDFTSNAESVDMSTKANNKNLFSGITADLAFSWSGQNGTLVSGLVEYSSPVSTPEPGMLGMLGVGGVMMMRRRRSVRI